MGDKTLVLLMKLIIQNWLLPWIKMWMTLNVIFRNIEANPLWKPIQLQHIFKEVLIMDTEFPVVNFCCTIGQESIIGLGYVLNPIVNISGSVKLYQSVLVSIGSQVLQYVNVSGNSIRCLFNKNYSSKCHCSWFVNKSCKEN